jgi:hypothetical protein
VIGEERYEQLRTLAKAAKGRSMLHIKSHCAWASDSSWPRRYGRASPSSRARSEASSYRSRTVIQIQDGVSGYLVTSPEECADRCLDLLREPALRKRMAAAGREHVRENFLITRDLRDQLELVATYSRATRATS